MRALLKEIWHLFRREERAGKASPPIKDVFLGIFIGAFIAIVSALGVFQKFEYLMFDGMFRLRGERSANDNIVIVGIDDASLEVLGRWPWPREYHANFIEILNTYNPRFVVFDILFPESDPTGDEAMALVAKEKQNLYLASYFVIEGLAEKTSESDNFDVLSLPHLEYKIKDSEKFLHASSITLPVQPLMEAAKRVSPINAPLDVDGSIRHLPLLVELNKRLYPTLSLQLASDYLGVAINDIRVEPGVIILPLEDGDIRIPIDSEGRMVLNFSGPIDAFEQYSYIQLLHDYSVALEEGRRSILENLGGKIVFIGQTATGTVDLRIMPFSNQYPALGIHATALGNILEKDLIRKSPEIWNILAILIGSILLSLFVKRGRRVLVNLTAMLILFSAFAVSNFLSFIFLNFWFYAFSPLIAILLTYVAVSVNHYEVVRYEKKILENELFIARKIQQSFLPKNFPEAPHLEFAAKCNPAKHVGGDLYDFAELEGGKIGVVIGDVSGKGVPAALYMARTISEFRTASRTQTDAAATLKSLNEAFAKEGMEKSFITMQYLTFDLKSKGLTFSNGGHNTLLHFIKKEMGIDEIDTEGGMPIGVMEGIDFGNKEIQFDKGDILFLYTDGISEAMDKRHREFGLDRVKDILINNSDSKAEEIMSKVFADISKFSKGAPQHDDMTVVVIKAV